MTISDSSSSSSQPIDPQSVLDTNESLLEKAMLQAEQVVQNAVNQVNQQTEFSNQAIENAIRAQAQVIKSSQEQADQAIASAIAANQESLQ